MMTERPSCDNYMRMPLSEEVLEHIRAAREVPRTGQRAGRRRRRPVLVSLSTGIEKFVMVGEAPCALED